MYRIILPVILLIISFTEANAEENYGKYNGAVQTEWLESDRKMKLLADFSYVDPKGLIWHAKKDQIVDGASIPQVLWATIGGPFAGKYRNASVIHDIACDEKTRDWALVHEAFYYAMLASGVGKVKAKVMYAGVHHFGPRWPYQEKVIVKKASTRMVDVPAQYGTTTELVVTKPASKKWVKESKSIGKIFKKRKDPTSGKNQALIKIPAEYKTVTKQVIITPASKKKITTPATYKTITKTPPKKDLSEDKFKALEKLIEDREKSGEPLSLAEINTYK